MLALALTASLSLGAQALETPTGLWLGADLGGGVVDDDPVIAGSLGIGVEHEAFAVHLRAPIALRIVDLDPQVSPTQPAVCRVVRCEEWLEAGHVSAAALSRILDEARVAHPGALFHLRAGRLFATIGHGVLVDAYTNAADWDRRKSGAYAELNVPWGRTQAQALVGNVLGPHELFALRLATHPLASSDETTAVDRLLGRGRIAFEFAGDAVAPAGAAVDAFGDVIPSAASRPLLAGAAELSWPLLDEGALHIEPWIALSSLYGLSDDIGGSATLGLAFSFDAALIAVRVGARAFADSAGQRTSLFHTLYDVDRRRALRADGSFSPFGIAEEAAPGGVGGDADVELVVLRAVRLGLRGRADSVAQGSFVEAWSGLELDFLRIGARARQRALDAFGFGDGTLCVVEASWLVYGPFSVNARWLHAPRFTADANPPGSPIADDDVFVGAAFNIVLQP